MTYEERLEAAERHRAKGNALFQQVSLGWLFWVTVCALHLVELHHTFAWHMEHS